MSNREHGGNLDEAIARYGGTRADWLDLSTGINPVPWPVPSISSAAWTRLPEKAAHEALLEAARTCYRVADSNGIAAAAGVQALIQILPLIVAGSDVRVLSPTYNEYAAAFCSRSDFQVSEVADLQQLIGADIAVLVNPNNPDGRRHDPESLCDLAAGVGWLVVDEAFADTCPEVSLCPLALPDNVIVLRSFGKFFGLAGIRLGFAVTNPVLAGGIAALLGPWAVSGPAIEIGTSALRSSEWITQTRQRLSCDMNRMLKIFDVSPVEIVGGSDLFATVRTSGTVAVMNRLATERIWVRSFKHQPSWLRFGLPGNEDGWARLARALESS